MKLYPIKLLTVTCEILAQNKVIELLHKHGVSGYTSYEVEGYGSKGVRGHGFQNEKNIKIEVIIKDEKLPDVLEEITRTLFSDYAIIAYVSEVGILRLEKFT